MAAMSNYLEGKLIDHIFRGTALPAPTSVFIGLFTGAISDATTGTNPGNNELSLATGGYVRQQVTCNTTNWSAPTANDGTTKNLTPITFAPSADWGTVTGIGVFDGSGTGANLLFYGTLTASKTINSGDSVTFPANSLSIQIDG